ncbi:MAG: GatB/YqeY domain-containing protein [Patescibacteria group bacterium]
MSILQKIDTDYIEAYKAHNELCVSVLRLLKSALKNLAIASGKELIDKDVIRVIRREIKQREEAANQYKKAGRIELAQKEEDEVRILTNYLPVPLSREELSALIAETASTGQIDHPGRLTGAVIAKAQGRAESALIAKLAAEFFENKNKG